MRIMLDTNILVSMVFFPSRQTRRLARELAKYHQAVLCDYVIEELKVVVDEKFSEDKDYLPIFLQDFPFELIHTPKDTQPDKLPHIRDEKDSPILATALRENIDVFITGDKDFLVLDIETPRIMTMRDFLDEFGQ